jgi:tetratricopeptide (TPR) repeat protein
MRPISEIQFPAPKGEIPFQKVCLEYIRHYWGDENARVYGRKGQRQRGIDIVGRDYKNGYVNAGLQCKGSDTDEPRLLTEAEIEEEVEKGKKHKNKLDILIIAYAGKRDVNLQDKAKKLSNENEAKGLFKVVLWAWADIIDESDKYPEFQHSLLVSAGVAIAQLPAHLAPKRPSSGASAGTPAIASLQAAMAAMADLQQTLQTEKTEDVGDPAAQAKLDFCRDQILSGEGKSVVAPLQDFIANLPLNAPPRLKFRGYANLGAALTQAGDFTGAAHAFDEAVKVEPDTADGLAYAARAALTREKRELAHEKATLALERDLAHRLAATIFIDTAPAEVKAADLELKLAAAISHPDIGAALSRKYADEGAHDEALRLARQIDDEEDNWTRPLTIGEAILSRFQNDFDAQVGSPQSEETSKLLDEAKECLEGGWKQVKQRSDGKNWVHVAANLAAIYRLKGRMDLADNLALEAHKLYPDAKVIKEQVTLAYLHKGEIAEATKIADEIAESGGPEQKLLAANIAASKEDWPKAQKWAQKIYDNPRDDIQKGRAAELLILAAYKTTDSSQALKKADELRGTFDPNIGFEARVAEIARRAGDQTQLEAVQLRISAFEPAKLNAIERFELSEAYADKEDWGKSADLLADLHTNDRASEVLKRRLFALYRADNRRGEARKLFEQLEGEALKSKEILRLGAAIYERSGLLPQAVKLLEQALQLDEKDLRSRLDWVRLSLRASRDDEVKKWAKKAATDYVAAPVDLMELAQVLDRYGSRRTDALALGYDTLRKNYGRSEAVHMHFNALFLMRGTKMEKFLVRKTVEEDTAVYLKDDRGAQARYVIARETPAPDVLSPEHEFAKKLMGAKVGDKISLPVHVGQPQEWEIVELRHKYVDLFNRSLNEHATLFPKSRSIGNFHVDPGKEDGFEPMFEQVRDRARRAEEISKIYEEQLIPVDTVAKSLGVDPIDASLGLRFRVNKRFDNCLGTHEERAKALAQIRGASKIMLEPITLAIWRDIGLLNILEKIDSIQIVVVQSTIDALKNRAEEAYLAITQEGGSIEARGDRIVLTETPKAEREAFAKRLSEFEAWVRTHSTVVPTESIKDEVPEEDISKILSHASIDTIATAAAEKITLVCEDRRLRMLAQSMGLESSGWTQVFLTTLLEAGKIARDQYVELIANLQRNKVGFVSIGQDDLICAAEIRADDYDAIVDALVGPNVDVRSIWEIGGLFIFRLWTQSNYLMMRERLTSKILSGLLMKRPDGIKLVQILSIDVSRNLRNLGWPLNTVAVSWKDYVGGFVVGHFIGEAISRA